jgi:hypothetical protein
LFDRFQTTSIDQKPEPHQDLDIFAHKPSSVLQLTEEFNTSANDPLNSKTEQMKKEERIRTTELSEIKKHMNGIINRRAMIISSRYEGVNQDEKLRQLNSLTAQLEQEINRLQTQNKKNKSGKVIHSSSPLIENNSMMSTEKLLLKLNKELENAKEKVSSHASLFHFTTHHDL